jgi:uncharacterized protein (DUF58 family)
LGAAAVFGFLTDRAGDRVGALVLRNGEKKAIPAQGGRAHVWSILSLLGEEPAGESDMASALVQVTRLRRRRGLVVVVSDFADSSAGAGAPDWARDLRGISTMHDVFAVEVFGPRVGVLTDVGVVQMIDPESGRIGWVDTHSRAVRRRFADDAERRTADVGEALRSAGVFHVPLSTEGDWVASLVSAVLGRRRTLASTGRS